MRDLTPSAIDLLSAIAETPGAAIAGAILMDHYGAVASQLLNRGLLITDGHETTTTSLADHDDVPVTVSWSPEYRAFGYFSGTAGWVTVPGDRLAMHHISFDKLLHEIMAPLFASKRITVSPLLPNLLWEVGDVQLPGRGKRVPLWIGRRFADAGVWGQFSDITCTRPAPGLRIVLSFTPGNRLPAAILNGHEIIPVRDVARHVNGLVIDPDILAARVTAGYSPSDALIIMAADGASIMVRRKRYKFSGPKQRAVIRQLYEAWESGTPERLTTEVLEQAEFSGSTNILAKAFSGRSDWREFIKEESGRCWMFT